MKKKIFLLSTLLLVFGCNNTVNTLPNTTNSPTTNTITSNDSTTSTTTNPSVNPTTSAPINDPRAEAYGYKEHISDVMPRIDVTTADGSNEFATKYDRNDKLAGKIDYVDCTITTSNCDEDYILNEAVCEIKVRGNYTLNYAKKPFRLKFDKKQKMFGLNDNAKAKSWVLLADWKDRSLSNNATNFFLGNTILASDGYYSSDYRHVEVYLNGKYWGVYLLAEQQQLNEYRIDLTEPEDDYEGTDIGYLLEYDNKYIHEDPEKGGDYTFEVDYNNGAKIQKYDGSSYVADMKGFSIKSDITSINQVNFIKSFINNVYNIMYNAAYNNEAYVFNDSFTEISKSDLISAREAIENVVDVQSLVDTYIISEIACDADVAKSSFYMDCSFEEGNFKKLTFEAPWDYDSAYGIKSNTCNSGEGLFAANSVNPWLTTLINLDWFRDMVKEKWTEIVRYKVLERSIAQIENISTTYQKYFDEEYEKWPGRLSMSELTNEVNAIKTQKEASEYLTRWLKIRYDFINSVWGDGEKIFNKEIVEEIPEGYDYYRFEAEDAITGGSISIRENEGASQGKCCGDVNHSGNSITFNLTSSTNQKVKMYLGIAKRNVSCDLGSIIKLSVNDNSVSLPSIPIQKTSGSNIWFDFYQQYVCDIDLVEGQNVIKLSMSGSGGGTNIDYLELLAGSSII